MLELAEIVKLQDEWLKHRASSLYIDPLLIQLKVRLIAPRELSEAFVKSWHPLAQIDQISAKGLERAFVYWRDLVPLSDRFKDQFGSYGTRPGTIDYSQLVELGFFSRRQFDKDLNELHTELLQKSNGEWVDYDEFVRAETFEKKVLRAYLLAFLISDGMASLKSDPLTGQIWTTALAEKAEGPPKSMAVSVTGAT